MLAAAHEGTDMFAAAIVPLALAVIIAAALAFLAVRLADASASERRTSGAAQLDPELGADVAARVAELLDTTAEHFEAPVLTRYRAGEQFALHGDASATRGEEWAEEGGQRVVTCILYLNDVLQGGRTIFDQAGVAVAPRAGDACVFFPSDHTTRDPDPRTTHYAEAAVNNQEKFIIQVFERERPVPPPLGLPLGQREWSGRHLPDHQPRSSNLDNLSLEH
jgi:prolyl 4-hydroxylase